MSGRIDLPEFGLYRLKREDIDNAVEVLTGRHLASKLLNPVLEHFDKVNSPCYLETHNIQNIVKYEHYGFKIAETGLLPGSDKTHWAMVRIPLRKREIDYA